MSKDEQNFSAPIPERTLRQGDLFYGDTRWTWVMSSLFSSGKGAEIGSNAGWVLVCLRCAANWQTGLAWMAQETIGEQCGMSRSTVRRALEVLEKHKLIEKKKISHKKVLYAIRDEVPFFRNTDTDDDENENAEPVGILPIDFRPLQREKQIQDAQYFFRTGRMPPKSKIQPIFLQVVLGDIYNNQVEGNAFIAQGDNQKSAQKPIRLTKEMAAMLQRVIAETDLIQDDDGDDGEDKYIAPITDKGDAPTTND